MFYIFRLTIVILIFYLKLNGLNTTPLIDRNKSIISSDDNIAPAPPSSNERNTANTNSILTTPITITTTTTTIIIDDNKEKRQIDNAAISSSINNNDNNNNNNNNSNNNKSINNNESTKAINNNNNNNNNDIVTIIANASNAPEEISQAQRANTYYQYEVLEEGLTHGPEEIVVSATTNTTTTTTKHPNATSRANAFNEDRDLEDVYTSADADKFLLKYDNNVGSKCMLDDLRERFLWWSYSNGSLKMSNLNATNQRSFLDLSFSNASTDDALYAKTRLRARGIEIFSAAHNNLTHAPYRTLSLMTGTLKYLTLKGNQFASYATELQKEAINRYINGTFVPEEGGYTPNNITVNNNKNNNNTNTSNNKPITYNITTYNDMERKYFGRKEEGIAWATFPVMPELLELDISACHIEFITSEAFRNLTNLRRLFAARNKILTIQSDTFQHVGRLYYLDLSSNNVLDFDYQLPFPTLEAVINLIYGVKIQQTTFKYLPELVYLDLSHTKMTRNSVAAFTHLGEKLKYLSLCYTAFPMISNALFKNTALVGLDLSGNPYASYNILDDAFEGVADTLRYLYFERSNIKDMEWLKWLGALRVLGLSGNNINSVAVETYRPLASLQMLDLSSNHVGNWYNRAFTHNEQLRVLNLRDNNINIINLEMLRDFQTLDYLSLGDNNFVCDCLLQELVNIGSANNRNPQCSRNVLQEAQTLIGDNVDLLSEYVAPNVSQMLAFKPDDGVVDAADVSALLMQRYLPSLRRSYNNVKAATRNRLKVRLLGMMNANQAASTCPSESIMIYDKLNGTPLQFQLLDYEEEHYWCFNETERMNFFQLNCQARILDVDIAEELHRITNYVLIVVGSVLGVSLLGIIVYLKRWHIHYYYSSVKSATLLSMAARPSTERMLADQDPNLVYDIFLSYCQNDRQWILDELLPNVEEAGDISICMHERDFQIGLSIFDNIVSCMDRSKALMLIISTNFLLSQWCQFEMHLAQNRIFEMSKDHLIIVFLEDIPRCKRPKNLQYLMEVITYIKWPSGRGNEPPSPDERKLFWKRLRRAVQNVGVNPNA